MTHVRRGAFQSALRRGDAQDDLLLADEVDHPREERHDALASRVHDPCLLEHRQLLRRVRERALGCLVRRAQHVRRFRRSIRRMNGLCGCSHHAQHRPLDRIADGLIARVRCGLQRRCERCAVCLLAVGQPAREPLHELGEDDAAVAPRPEQRPPRDRAAHRPHRSGRRIRHFGGRRRAERQQHIDAGVAIRDREDVERVDGIGVGLEAACASEDELMEVLGVERGRCLFVHGFASGARVC